MNRVLLFIQNWRLLAILPLLILLIDILIFPILFHTQKVTEDISLSTLLSEKHIYLGRYKCHRIYVSADNIYEKNYLNHLTDSKTAVVISHFINKDRDISKFGALGRAVNSKLKKISSNDNQNFFNLIKRSPDYSAGKVLDFHLQIKREFYREFPVDNIFVVLFNESAGPNENLDIIKEKFRKIIVKAKNEHINNLVIPPLSIKPEERHYQVFKDFFTEVFKVVTMGKYPANIYFSLYTEWPTPTFEIAVSGLDDIWNAQFADARGRFQFLFKPDFRMILIFLSLCLFSSSSATLLTLKNFLIISSTFLGLSLGSNVILGFLTYDYHPDMVLIIKFLLFLVIAIFFRCIIYWDPKNIFYNVKE
jgi:hypothetical protein